MNIERKIERIRKMPENVRIRYAWIFSIAITLVIIIFWIITLAAQKPEKPGEDAVVADEDILENIGAQKESIKDAAQGMKKTLDTNRESVNPITRQ